MSAKDQLLEALNEFDKKVVNIYTDIAIQNTEGNKDADIDKFVDNLEMHNVLKLIIPLIEKYGIKILKNFAEIANTIPSDDIDDEKFIKYLDKKIRDWKIYHGSNEE